MGLRLLTTHLSPSYKFCKIPLSTLIIIEDQNYMSKYTWYLRIPGVLLCKWKAYAKSAELVSLYRKPAKEQE